MRADFKVVLDACVLIPMPLADTLLRLPLYPSLAAADQQRVIDAVFAFTGRSSA